MMSFTIMLRQKRGLFQKAVALDLEKILRDMKLKYGSYDEAFVMQPEEVSDKTFVFYNPQRIGRGIFFYAGNIAKNGEVVLRHMQPTTPSEIKDFYTIINAIWEQYGNIECYVEGQIIDEERLWDLEKEETDASLTQLHTFFKNAKEEQPIQTLAKFPYTFSLEQKKDFASAKDLSTYEALLHEVQKKDYYYAKPSIFKDKENGTIRAVYVASENCESVFPLDGRNVFLSIEVGVVDEAYVQFVIHSSQRVVDHVYDYKSFISYVITHKIFHSFDATHIIIPPMNEDEIMRMCKEIAK